MEVDGAGWEPEPLPPIRFGRLVADSGSVRVSAQGFPEFQRQPDGRCDLEELSGRVPAGTRALSRRYQIRIDGEPPQPVAGLGSPWQGMSGAAVRSAGDLLLGVCVEDPANTGHGRLTAVPAYLLLADGGFRRVVEAATGWPVQLEPAELAPLLAPPVPPPPRSPAGLLRAEARVVRFYGRDREVGRLRDWCHAGACADVRLLSGPGGQGKTRLAGELVRVMGAEGWVGGFVARFEALDRDEVVAGLGNGAVPLLLVVDYAETRRQELPRMIERAHRVAPAPVRILLLARSAGEWWETLCEDAMLEAAGEVPLGPLVPAADRTEFRTAATDLAKGLRRVPGYEGADWHALVPDLDARVDLAGEQPVRALTVHMAALAALLQRGPERVAERSVEDILLAHEGRYWRRNATAAGPNLAIASLREAVAAATLFGAANRAEARAVVDTLPGLAGQPEDLYHRAEVWLSDLYPGPDADVGGWQPLEPDRLGEHLVATELRRSTRFLSAALGRTSAGQHRRVFTVLDRAATRHRWLDDLITQLVADQRLLATAVDVAPSLSRPDPVVQGLYRWLDDDPDVLDLVRYGEALPEHTQVLAGWAVALTDRLRQIYRAAVANAASPESRRLDMSALASALHVFNQRLSEVGRWEEALAATEEAVAVLRELAGDLPGQLPLLAESLNSLSIDLAAMDRPEQALAAAEESVAIWRRLAQTQPDASQESLAQSLNTLSIQLAELERWTDGLRAAQESVAIWRQLAAAHPGDYRADLAQSLNNLSAALADIGRPKRGLPVAEEAVAIWRELADQQPDRHRGDLAGSLHTLAIRLADVDRHEPASVAIGEAVTIWRELAAIRPAVFAPHLARSLWVRGERLLWRCGRVTEAAETLVEALRLAVDHAEEHTRRGVAEALAEMYATVPTEIASVWRRETGEPVPDWMWNRVGRDHRS